MKRMVSDRWLGLLILGFAFVLVFIWAAIDTGTGLVEMARGRLSIGDALAPVIAGLVLGLGAVMILIKPSLNSEQLSKANIRWMLGLFVIFAVSLCIIRYLGPIVASFLTETGYRPLRDTLPWKYLGYILGGTVLIAGLGLHTKGKITWVDVIVGLVASLLIALAYDLPFEDLLLPPNGDI